MAQRKTELQQAQEDIGDVKDMLQEAYTPESSREDLAEAIGKTFATLEDYESDDDDDQDDDQGEEDEYASLKLRANFTSGSLSGLAPCSHAKECKAI